MGSVPRRMEFIRVTPIELFVEIPRSGVTPFDLDTDTSTDIVNHFSAFRLTAQSGQWVVSHDWASFRLSPIHKMQNRRVAARYFVFASLASREYRFWAFLEAYLSGSNADLRMTRMVRDQRPASSDLQKKDVISPETLDGCAFGGIVRVMSEWPTVLAVLIAIYLLALRSKPCQEWSRHSEILKSVDAIVVARRKRGGARFSGDWRVSSPH
jgi:hypothetical protein